MSAAGPSPQASGGLPPGRLDWRAYALLALAALAFFLPGQRRLPPVDRDESRYAQATTQMLETRNFLDVRYQVEPSTALPDVLPPSVQTLSVEGCKEMSLRMLIGQLKMVLGLRPKRFVGLRRLDIEGFFHDEEDEDASGYDAHAANPGGEKVIKSRIYEMTEALHISCAEAGIELHLRDRDCPATMA